MTRAHSQPVPIRVRPARAGDAHDMDFLTTQAARVATGAPSWHASEEIAASVRYAITRALQTEQETEIVLIAEDARARRLGFVYALAIRDPFTGEAHGHISDIVVAPDAEGSGVGRSLLSAAEAWATDRHLRSMTLHVFPANTRARTLYERLGYELDWLRLRKAL